MATALSTLPTTASARKLYAMGAEFPTAAALFHAAEEARDHGFKRWDVFSPFPIHGMDDAMGLGKSVVSFIVLGCGLTGTATALLLELGSALYLYPMIVQGKPTNGWAGFTTIPAFFPVIFELTVLFSAFGAVFGMLAMNLLPRWHHPLFNWDRFGKVTDDGFFLVVEASDARFSEKDTQDFLQRVGGTNITLVYDDE